MKKKKIASIVIGLLFILVVFWGCKEDIVDPVDPVATYTLKITQSGPGSIIPSGSIQVTQGQNVALEITKEFGIESKALLNGTELPLVDGKYIVNDISSDSNVEVTFEKTAKWQLMQHDWRTLHWKTSLVSDPLNVETSIPSIIANLHFDIDTLKMVDVSNGKLVGDMPYKIKGDSIMIGKGTGTVYEKITELNDSVFSYKGFGAHYYFDEKLNKWVPDPSKDGWLEIVNVKVRK